MGRKSPETRINVRTIANAPGGPSLAFLVLVRYQSGPISFAGDGAKLRV